MRGSVAKRARKAVRERHPDLPEVSYNFKKKTKHFVVPGLDGKAVVLTADVEVATLNRNCKRYKLKEIKKIYKAIKQGRNVKDVIARR